MHGRHNHFMDVKACAEYETINCMGADFISGEKAERNRGMKPMKSQRGRERGDCRGDNTGKKQNDTFTDAAQIDQLNKMKLREQEESTESSHDPQPTEDNIRPDQTN